MNQNSDQIQYKTSQHLRTRCNLHVRYANLDWFDWVATHMALLPNTKILDIGCGGGWFWRAAQNHVPQGLQLTLSDSSDGMVTEAVRHLTATNHFMSIVGKTADAVALPFANGSFDAVIAMHMLYHIPSPEQAIREFARVLRPDGFIAVTTNGRDNFSELFALSAQAFGGSDVDPAATLFGLDAARDMLSKHFTEVNITRFEDTYVIHDPVDIFQYLTSLPPGIDVSDRQKDRLRSLIETRLNQSAGVLKVKREAALVTARQPIS